MRQSFGKNWKLPLSLTDSVPCQTVRLTLCALTTDSFSYDLVVQYESYCLAANWYCDKYDFERPSIIGVEIQDDETGDWSFIMLCYGFIHKEFQTWAAHFSSARQMASLIKALSECKKIHYPRLGDLRVLNVPQSFAEEYGLSFTTGQLSAKCAPVMRLPVSAKHPHQSGKAVHWIGRGSFESTTRA